MKARIIFACYLVSCAIFGVSLGFLMFHHKPVDILLFLGGAAQFGGWIRAYYKSVNP